LKQYSFLVAFTVFLSPLQLFLVTVAKQKLSSENCNFDKVILRAEPFLPVYRLTKTERDLFPLRKHSLAKNERRDKTGFDESRLGLIGREGVALGEGEWGNTRQIEIQIP